MIEELAQDKERRPEIRVTLGSKGSQLDEAPMG